ncbi:MAG: glycerophosphodiester phosphodiesterase family protein, partial [Gammaproteobacteria bacterium]|nr:glycerophosphodiester phosphodiesterase family protein [Gammaproteobacteria bacterium]
AIASDKVDGFEFDVVMIKDGTLVLFHDDNLKRMTGVDKDIRETTWPELKELIIPKDLIVDGVPMSYPTEERIPRLIDVLEEVKGTDCFFDLDMKSSFPKWSTRHTGTEVGKLVNQVGVADQMVSTTIDFFMLYMLKKTCPAVSVGFAYDDDIPVSAKFLNWVMERDIVGRWINASVTALEYTVIDDNSIQKYHKRNKPVGTYTLFPLGKETELKEAHTKEVQRLVSLDVDWIESDNPLMVREALGWS